MKIMVSILNLDQYQQIVRDTKYRKNGVDAIVLNKFTMTTAINRRAF